MALFSLLLNAFPIHSLARSTTAALSLCRSTLSSLWCHWAKQEGPILNAVFTYAHQQILHSIPLITAIEYLLHSTGAYEDRFFGLYGVGYLSTTAWSQRAWTVRANVFFFNTEKGREGSRRKARRGNSVQSSGKVRDRLIKSMCWPPIPKLWQTDRSRYTDMNKEVKTSMYEHRHTIDAHAWDMHALAETHLEIM